MNVTVSPQMRVVLLAAALVAVALGLGLLMLSRATATSHPAEQTVTPPHPAQKAHAAARPKVEHTTPAQVHGKVKSPVPHPAAKTPAARGIAPNGLPLPVADALVKHPVVVVALYQARFDAGRAELRLAASGKSTAAAVGIDQDAFGEAAAGARLAGVGFVGVNVLSQREASPLVALVGVLPDPAVLVYGRPASLRSPRAIKAVPATMTVKLTGFVDRDTVAQAASDASAELAAAG